MSVAARNNPHFRRRGQGGGPWYIADALAVWPFTQADGFADIAKSNDLAPAGGAVIGGIIGALTSKDKAKGAATGAVAGGAAGGAIALATKGQQLELPVGQRFTVELTSPVQVQIASN